jgi:hypothetical protein
MTQLLRQIIQILDSAGISKLSQIHQQTSIIHDIGGFRIAFCVAVIQSPCLGQSLCASWTILRASRTGARRGAAHKSSKDIPSDEELVSLPMTESEWVLIQKVREVKKHYDPDSESDCVVVFVSDWS